MGANTPNREMIQTTVASKSGFGVVPSLHSSSLIGVVILPLRLRKQEEANSPDPNAEFTNINSDCVIVSFEYLGEIQRKCDPSSGNTKTTVNLRIQFKLHQVA
jgi:hypothetical protein